MSEQCLTFGFTGVLRMFNGSLCFDCGEHGTIPLLNNITVLELLRNSKLPEDTELGGEAAILQVSVPGIPYLGNR